MEIPEHEATWLGGGGVPLKNTLNLTDPRPPLSQILYQPLSDHCIMLTCLDRPIDQLCPVVSPTNDPPPRFMATDLKATYCELYSLGGGGKGRGGVREMASIFLLLRQFLDDKNTIF